MNADWQCLALQIMIDRIWSADQASMRLQTTGFLDFLLSPQNRQNFDYQTVIPDGKTRQLQVKYNQRFPTTELKFAATRLCDDGGTDTPLITNYNVTEYVEFKRTFSWTEFRLVCQDMPSFVRNVMMRGMMTLRTGINQKLVDSLFTQFGTMYGGASSLDVDFNTPISMTPISTILNQYQLASYTGGTPALIGHQEMNIWMIEKMVACCNDGGTNVANASGFTYWQDLYLYNKLNDNGVVGSYACLEPQAAQFVHYNTFVGEFTRNTENKISGTLRDPQTGIVYDYEWIFDDCEDKFTFRLSLNFDLFTQPTDIFDGADEFFNTNGTMWLNQI